MTIAEGSPDHPQSDGMRMCKPCLGTGYQDPSLDTKRKGAIVCSRCKGKGLARHQDPLEEAGMGVRHEASARDAEGKRRRDNAMLDSSRNGQEEAEVALKEWGKEQLILLLHTIWVDINLKGEGGAGKVLARLKPLYAPSEEERLRRKVAALEAEIAALKGQKALILPANTKACPQHNCFNGKIKEGCAIVERACTNCHGVGHVPA